VKYGTLNIEPL